MKASDKKDGQPAVTSSKVKSELKVRETRDLMKSVATDFEKEDGDIEDILNDANTTIQSGQ